VIEPNPPALGRIRRGGLRRLPRPVLALAGVGILAIALLGIVPAATSRDDDRCGPRLDGRSPERAPPPPSSPSSSSATTARQPGIMVVVLENRELCNAFASRLPYIDSLASRYAIAANAYGTVHPSMPNYLALVSGSTHGFDTNCEDCTATGETLVDQLDRAGIPWSAYMEGVPGPCFLGARTDERYAKKHNPFVYFPHLVAEADDCNRVVPYGRLTADLDRPEPPAFVWVTPDLCHDGHDCATVETDRWLRRHVEMVQASRWYRRGGTVVITWDEGVTNKGCCRGIARGGRIPTLVVSDRVTPGSVLRTPVTHAGILRTIEKVYGLPLLGDARRAEAGDLLALFPAASAAASRAASDDEP
jgi:hypothetical protein